MRLGLIPVSLPSRVFRFLPERGLFWLGDVECGLILPKSDCLQLYYMTRFYRIYAAVSSKMK